MGRQIISALVNSIGNNTGTAPAKHQLIPNPWIPVKQFLYLLPAGTYEVIDIIFIPGQFLIGNHAIRHEQLRPLTPHGLARLMQRYILHRQLAVAAAGQRPAIDQKSLLNFLPVTMPQPVPKRKSAVGIKSLCQLCQQLNQIFIQRPVKLIVKLPSEKPRHRLLF